MTEDKIEKKIIEIIQKRTVYKIKRIGKDEDIYKKKIIDSFDVLSIIQEIENFFKIKIKIEKLKKFKFSIKFLISLVLKKAK